jgi:hypothetical protein
MAIGYELEDGTMVPASDVLVVSKDRSTAKAIISMVRKHLDAAEQITGKKACRTDMGGMNDVYLTNGCRIVSMPGTPRSLQGFTGNVIVDELSANRWSIDEMMGQAMSVTSSRDYFKLVVVTNADVEGSYTHNFFESEEPYWTELRKPWLMKSINIYDAYPEGLPERLKKRKQGLSQAMWQRFYECKFIGSGAGLLDREQFKIVDALPAGKVRYCISVDPGFSDKGNPSGVSVLAFVEGKFYVVYANLWFNKTIDEQAEYIEQLIKVYRPEKLIIDRGAQGWGLAEKFKHLSICEPMSVNNTLISKSFNTLLSILEDNKFLIVQSKTDKQEKLPPLVDTIHIIEDFCSIHSGDNETLEFPQRPVKETDHHLLACGALRTNKIHSDCLVSVLMAVTWAASVRGTGVVTGAIGLGQRSTPWSNKNSPMSAGRFSR